MSTDIPNIDKIMDGFWLPGYIGAIVGVHSDLEFTYRPVDPLTMRRHAVAQGRVISSKSLSDEDKEVALEVLQIELALRHVDSWNLADSDGRPVDKSLMAVLRHFPGYRYKRLLDIVIGGLPSDQRPDRSTSEAPSRDTGNLEEAEKNL